jgi:K(+)-stimulated pyrophosphate-energized sodium pump
MLELPWWWWLAPASAGFSLLFAAFFYRQVMSAAPGDEEMRRISDYVREGAYAYLKQQYRVVAIVFAVLTLVLMWQSFGLKQQHGLVPFAFLTGGFFSGLAGFIGMSTATLAASRTAEAAKESLNRALQVAFRAGAVMGLVVVGLGLLDVSLWFWLLAWLLPRMIDGFVMSIEQITVVMLCFGMGASTQALFARVGGGIFTKSADVGADLVGKIEAGIPEDDARNPAVIADNVGDNVGDIAGMGADLYESYCGSILATAALGAAAASALQYEEPAAKLSFVLAPMVLAGVGIVVSVLSIFLVKTREGASQANLLYALRRGVWGASGLIFVLGALVCYLVLPEDIWRGVFGAIATGLIAGVAIGWSSEFHTSSDYRPTRSIAEQTQSGPGTTVIAGLAEGMLSSWPALAIVGVSTLLAYVFAGGTQLPETGLYGIGMAAVGMLATLGITLASDAYGPIADNAGGNAEMTHQPDYVRERTDALDALGNTTAATGKGFAIGSAALTGLALLAAFVEEVRVGIQRESTAFVQAHLNTDSSMAGKLVALGRGKFAVLADRPDADTGFFPAMIMASSGAPYIVLDGEARPATDEELLFYGRQGHSGKKLAESIVYDVQNPTPANPGTVDLVHLVPVQKARFTDFMELYEVHLMNPRVLVGMFFGVMMVYIFCGLTMKAVGRAAGLIMAEARRQFHELGLLTNPGAKADYARCVVIATSAAQKEMIVPALLAVVIPLAVGMLLDVSGIMGLLAGSLTSGFAMAVFMSNSGGAWDNAKKYIEAGHLGGKGSEAHKAGIVGDTVGDPFKDTSGPSLNILIKLMSMVAIVFAGVIVKYSPVIAVMLGIDQ